MKLVRRFREEIQNSSLSRLAYAVNEELDSIVARIRTGWNKQHNADGGHADITSTSVNTTALLAGRFVTPPLEIRVPGSVPVNHILGTGNPEFSKHSFIRLRLPDDSHLIGIDNAGRQAGDHLWILNIGGGSNGEVFVDNDETAAPQGQRISWGAFPPYDPNASFTLFENSVAHFVYDVKIIDPLGPVGRWIWTNTIQ